MHEEEEHICQNPKLSISGSGFHFIVVPENSKRRQLSEIWVFCVCGQGGSMVKQTKWEKTGKIII